MKNTIFLNGNFGWCVTKWKKKWAAAFGDESQVAVFPPYTTRYQAKKIAKQLAAQE